MKNKDQKNLEKLDGSKGPVWLGVLMFILAALVSYAAFYFIQGLIFR